jgi:ABC-type glycerol-3-phosphate transport system substrate-binding protein
LNTLIGRQSDIAGRDHLTLAEVKELEESAGNDAKAFYSDSDTSILYSICESNYNRYIDWKTGECHFKDSDFGDILEYAATYPRADNANYISSGEEEESFPSKIRNKKIIFADCYSMSMEEIELYSAMFDDEIGFIGYPSEEKNGAGIIMSMDLGIYSKSANKEGAWEFIKTMLTTEMTNNFNLYDGFPLRKDSLESIIKAKSTTTSYVDEFGNEITPLESTWGWDDLEVEIKPLTDEQVEMLRELIASADHLSGAQEDIMSIITEEADDYFNGVKSKDEVVNIIQNRVSTYVNENK